MRFFADRSLFCLVLQEFVAGRKRGMANRRGEARRLRDHGVKTFQEVFSGVTILALPRNALQYQSQVERALRTIGGRGILDEDADEHFDVEDRNLVSLFMTKRMSESVRRKVLGDNAEGVIEPSDIYNAVWAACSGEVYIALGARVTDITTRSEFAGGPAKATQFVEAIEKEYYALDGLIAMVPEDDRGRFSALTPATIGSILRRALAHGELYMVVDSILEEWVNRNECQFTRLSVKLSSYMANAKQGRARDKSGTADTFLAGAGGWNQQDHGGRGRGQRGRGGRGRGGRGRGKSNGQQQQGKKPDGRKCYGCQQFGHIRRDCPRERSSAAVAEAFAGNFAAGAATAMFSSTVLPVVDDRDGNLEGYEHGSTWSLDSGASISISSMAADFTGKKLVKHSGCPEAIRTAGGGKLEIMGYADVTHRVVGTSGKMFTFSVYTAFVPDAADGLRLLSVPSLEDGGVRLESSGPNEQRLRFPRGFATIVRRPATEVRGYAAMYRLPTFVKVGDAAPAQSTPVLLPVERKRLTGGSIAERLAFTPRGGVSGRTIRQSGDDSLHSVAGHVCNKTARKVGVDGISGRDRCEICDKAGLPAAPKEVVSRSPDGYDDVVTADVVGFSEPSVPNGNKYALVLVDVDKFVYVIPMTSKAHTVKAFETFCDTSAYVVSAHTRFHSDSESVFTGHEFKAAVKARGMVQTASPPYHHERNGIVEAAIKSTKRLMRKMLLNAALGDQFWSLALKHAAFTLNRVYHGALKMSPYQKKTGRAYSLTHLHTFGEPALVTMEEWQKPRTGMWVGFDDASSSHLIYMGDTGRLIRSVNVRFLAHKWGSGMDLEHIKDIVDGFGDLPPMVSLPADAEEVLADASDDEPDGVGTASARVPPLELTSHPPVVDKTVLRRSGRIVLKNATLQRSDAASVVALSVPQLQVLAVEAQHEPDELWRAATAMELLDDDEHEKAIAYVNYLEGSNLFALSAEEDGDHPTLRQALTGPEKEHWQRAVAKEVQMLKDNGVVEEVDPGDVPPNKTPLRGHFVNSKKRDGANVVTKYKARMVAQGNRQRADRGDFDPSHLESFTFIFSSLLLMLTLAVAGAWFIENSDVVTAFHNSDLLEPMYMWVPKGVEHLFSSMVVKIVKGLYGLKQSPRLWYDTLLAWLISLGFERSDVDPCLFTYRDGDDELYLVVWVDDFIYASPSAELMTWFKQQASARFSMKHLGPLEWCLGLKVDYKRGGSLIISQTAYIRRLGEVFGVTKSKRGVKTPMARSHEVAEPCEPPTAGLPYRKLVGALLYVAKRTRPEISFHVSLLSRFNTRYSAEHYEDALQVLQYLVDTAEIGMTVRPSKDLKLTCFTDASYGVKYVERRSITGMCTFLGGNLIAWASCAQKTTARSTAESEYLALDVGVKELMALRNVLKGLGFAMDLPSVVYCDNTAAIAIAGGTALSRKAKHMDIIYYFVREQVKRGLIKLIHRGTDTMVADVLTKALEYDALVAHRAALLNE